MIRPMDDVLSRFLRGSRRVGHLYGSVLKKLLELSLEVADGSKRKKKPQIAKLSSFALSNSACHRFTLILQPRGNFRVRFFSAILPPMCVYVCAATQCSLNDKVNKWNDRLDKFLPVIGRMRRA